MRQFVAAVAAVTLACGGGETAQDSAESSAATSGAAAAATPAASGGAATGTVHTIDMVLNDAGEYRYVPDQMTIQSGDAVQWINVSGGPHNVQFKPDAIPGGASDVLNAAMADRIGDLNGALMVAPNAVYEISFAGAPAGTYDYTCTPHELLGMNATLTIQ